MNIYEEMGYYDDYGIEIQDERTRKIVQKIAQNIVNDTLNNKLPVVILGVRDDHLVEFVDSYPSRFYVEQKDIKKYIAKYKKVIIVYGIVKDGINTESESHT